MSNPSKSLSSQVKWLNVLPVFNIRLPDVTVLPQCVDCPVCKQSKLTIHEDTILGGQWAACSHCTFAGDLIELVAAKQDIEISAAVSILSDRELFAETVRDDCLDAYLADHIEYRRRVNEFWKKARCGPAQPTECIRDLMRKFKLIACSYEEENWVNGKGNYLGSASRQEIENLYAPLSYDEQLRSNHDDKTSKRRGGGTGNRRLFQGQGWNELLVVPFHDLPGRISGFLFVGRDADPTAGDFIYKRLNLGSPSRQVLEAGVGMAWSVSDRMHKELKDTVFVMSDPQIAILLQCVYMRDHTVPLPIVLGHFAQETQTWTLPPQLVGRRLVFWGDHPSLLRMAKRMSGLYSTYRISKKEVENRLGHSSPTDWLRKINEHAVPWVRIVKEKVSNLDLKSTVAVLKNVGFSPTEMQHFAEHNSLQLRERLAGRNLDRIIPREVTVGGKVVVETPTGWRLKATDELLCNFSIRIEEIALTEDKRCYYRCLAFHGDRDYRFTIAKTEVDKNGLLKCAHTALLDHSFGHLSYNSRWSKQALHIAIQLYPPKHYTCVDRVGWCELKNGFQFPQFLIQRGDEKITDEVWPFIDVQTAPARHIEYPGLLSGDDVILLSREGPETAMIWAMMACLVHNIATPLRKSPYGIILDGEYAHSAGRAIAKVMGCNELPIGMGRRNHDWLKLISDAGSQHDWPILVPPLNHACVPTAPEWVDESGIRNAILCLNRAHAVSLAANTGFFHLRLQSPVQTFYKLRQSAAKLIPLYLQHVCASKMWIDRGEPHFLYDVINGVAEWFEQNGGKRNSVGAARRIVYVDSLCPAVSLVDLVERILRNGQIIAAYADMLPDRRGAATYVRGLASDTGEDEVWLCPNELSRAMRDGRILHMDFTRCAQSIQDAGAWLGTKEIDGVSGWSIAGRWWDEQLVELANRGRLGDLYKSVPKIQTPFDAGPLIWKKHLRLVANGHN